MQTTGTAPVMMGDLAERWTASELRPLQRQGWRVVNHLMLRRTDIDHVVVGPRGAFALETKWSAASWSTRDNRERLVTAARRIQAHANDLSRWAPFSRHDVRRVQPLVVLWGSDARHDDSVEPEIEGVPVVPGSELRPWLSSRPPADMSSQVVHELWEAMDRQCATRDGVEGAPPRTRTDAALRVALLVGTAAAAFLLGTTVITELGVTWGLAAGAVVTVSLAWVARYPGLRAFALAATVGVGSVLVLMAIVAAGYVLSSAYRLLV